MDSGLENFKFLNYNNGLRLGVVGIMVKLYTPLRVVKNIMLGLTNLKNLQNYTLVMLYLKSTNFDRT